MINTASALRRGLFVVSLPLVFLAVTLGIMLATSALAASAQEQVQLAPAAPSTTGDIWSPSSGTVLTYYSMSNLQVVARLTKAITNAFDTSSARYSIVNSSGQMDYVPTVGLADANGTAIMTATGFTAHTTGDQIQFKISYVGKPGYYSTATYPFVVYPYKLYFPVARYDADGSNPCRAIPANPNTQYRTAQDQQYRFFKLTLPTTATIYVTATNYTVSGGQMQMHSPYPSCDPTDPTFATLLNYVILPGTSKMATYNLVPGTYYVRFSASQLSSTPFYFAWGHIGGVGPGEVNNTLCTAHGVTPGYTYWAYPDDLADYYYFDSSLANASMQIVVTGFNLAGQYQLIKGNPNCTNFIWPPLAVGTASTGAVTMTVTGQNPGRYFLRVQTLNQSGFNQSKAYTFRIGLSTALLSNPGVTTSGEPAPTPVPLPVDGSWSGLPPANLPDVDPPAP